MTRDWDARTYHRVSAPHQEWAEALFARLDLRGDESVLDAGCGSGRVTAKLLERLPEGHVVAVDGAPSMIEQAREVLDPDRSTVLQADLLELELTAPVDAVFSSAVFHWITDHERLFTRLHAALKPGGRLVAQCGGRGNIGRFRNTAAGVGEREPYAGHLAGFMPVWNYAGPEETEARLRAAGFTEAHCRLEPWDAAPPEPGEYIRSICLAPVLERLPENLRDAYLRDVLAAAGDPLVLDYVRLNIDATA